MAYVIRGTVRDPSGAPVPGARVYFVGGPDPFPDVAAVTSEQGGFALSAPSGGRYRIESVADGFAPEVTAVDLPRAAETGVEIRLSPVR
jgi:hypothetical protein